MSTYSYEVYHYFKDRGICVDCKVEKAAKGKTRCLNCLSIKNERAMLKMALLSDEERAEMNRKKREAGKALREYRKANNLCRICGKPVYKNHSTCYEHYLKHKRIDRERRKKNNKGFAEIGLCRICGKPVVKDKKFCEEHLEKYRENIRKANERRLEKKKGGVSNE